MYSKTGEVAHFVAIVSRQVPQEAINQKSTIQSTLTT